MDAHLGKLDLGPLRLPNVSATQPDSRLLDAMRYARVEGERFRGTFWSVSTGRGFFRWLAEALNGLEELACGSGSARHALRAAFTYGLCREPFEMRDALPRPMLETVLATAALGQQELASALLELPFDMRRAINDRVDVIGADPPEPWRKTVAGAMTTARFASGALYRQLEVRFAPAEHDALHAGDLLVGVPRANIGLYVQVKGDATTDRVRLRLLDKDPSDDNGDPRDVQNLQALWRGAAKFQRVSNGARRFPLYARIGMRGLRPGQLAHAELDRVLGVFLDYLRQRGKTRAA